MQSTYFAAGHGQFTCCERGHRFAQRDMVTGEEKMQAVPCDKRKVASVMHVLVDKKVETLREELVAAEAAEREDLLFELRLVQARRAMMLAGLESEQEQAQAAAAAVTSDQLALRAFMGQYHFEEAEVDGSPADRRSGWTPLRYAVISDNLQAARELLARGAGLSPLLLPVLPVGVLQLGSRR